MKCYKRNRYYNRVLQRREKRRRIIATIAIYLLLVCIAGFSSAQEPAKMNTLAPGEMLQLVKQFHPVARQAEIGIEKARAGITMAKGAFDPVLYHSSGQKIFDGTDYYYYSRPELTIPAWFGIDFTAGFSYLSGNRTDPSETIGQTAFAGISLPLAKNLLIDKRRAALQTAKIYHRASENEKRIIMNDLLLEALTTYWNWAKQYQLYIITGDVVAANEKRLAMIRQAFRNGENPAIDTTEALAQLQQFQLLQMQTWLAFQNEGLNLSAFLWQPNDEPFVLPGEVVPDPQWLSANMGTIPVPELTPLLEAATRDHPALRQYDFRLEALTIERRLAFQELLPSINLRYNHLGKGYDLLKSGDGLSFANNFQYGITIGLPLRISRGRGEYRMARLKLTEAKLQFNQRSLMVENTIKNVFNELTILKKQLTTQNEVYHNYLKLLKGEEARMQAGESSLFLVNARETKALETLQKLMELRARYFQLGVKLNWAAGRLY